MVFRYAYLLPFTTSLLFAVTFLITYLISVKRKDVTPLYPYISDTGIWSPESCIFGLMLNIGAIMQGLIVYVRYRQVRNLFTKNNISDRIKKLNNTGVILGMVAAFGVSIVASFQETNLFVIHVMGAMAAFGLGSIYQLIQAYISFSVYPLLGDRKTNVARLVCGIICCVAFAVTFGFGGLALLEFRGDDPTKWKKSDGGYVNHAISVVAEWILVTVTMIFLMSFTKEFKAVSISEPLVNGNSA